MPASPLTKIMLFVCIVATKNFKAQWTLAYTGQVPAYRNANSNTGAKVSVFSGALNNSGSEKKDVIEFRLGLEGYGSKYNSTMVGAVPLQLPQTGNSTVSLNNNLFGGNLVARFSLPYNEDFIPYFDVFFGSRTISTMMYVKPDSVYKPSTTKIYKTQGNTYGAGIGAMIALGERWKLNLGFTFTNSDAQMKVLAIKEAHVESNALVLGKKQMPYGMVHFNFGVVINIDKDFMSCFSALPSCNMSGGGGCNFFSGFSLSDSDNNKKTDDGNNTSKPEPEKGKVKVIIQ